MLYEVITVKDVISYILKEFKYKLAQPVKLLGLLISIILLISVVECLGIEESRSSLSKVIDIIGVLICIIVMFENIASCINLTVDTLQTGSNFMLCRITSYNVCYTKLLRLWKMLK